MTVSALKLYDLLKARIGEKEAQAFIEILEKKVDEKFDEKKDSLATKEDIHSLRMASKEDLSNIRSELLRIIYLTSLSQLIAIIASVVSIILVLKK